jgi:hypothetical protein
MQSVIYRLSESYIRKKTKLPLAGPLTFAIVLALIISVLDFGKPLRPIYIGTTALLAFSLVFYKELRSRRKAAQKLPKMAVEVSDESLRLIDSGGAYEVPVSSIKAVSIDRRSNGPKVVYLHRIDAATIPVDDLDRMEQFATQVSRIVGAGKVSELKWWQRPPR